MANIIKMLKAVILVALALTAVNGDNTTPTKDFIQGFFAGLGKTNPSGACSTALTSLTDAVYGVINDLEVKNQNLQDVINSLNALQAMVTSVQSTGSTCDLGSLETQLEKVFSKGGMQLLVQNYLANGQAVFTDYQQIMTCSTNYYQCGYASGDAFEKLVGWSLD